MNGAHNSIDPRRSPDPPHVPVISQVFWAWLIVRVLFKLIRDGHVEDNRSDDESEPDHDSQAKKLD